MGKNVGLKTYVVGSALEGERHEIVTPLAVDCLRKGV